MVDRAVKDDKQPPWYGGNKIPQWYLDKIKTSDTPARDDLPYELRLFMEGMK